MPETIRVFDTVSLNKLREEYKCTSKTTPTTNVPVIINGEIIKMETGAYGNDHFIEFKKYADTSFTELYSYMFLIYLSSNEYTVGVGAGNIAFMSFSSKPLKDSTLYYIPSGTYVCQVFVNAGARFFVTLKKNNEQYPKYIYAYVLKCESIENDNLLYDEFYEQIASSCNNYNSSLDLCKKSLNMFIVDDPRFAAVRNNINRPGTIVNGEWVVTENSCPTICGTGVKKSYRNVFKYFGRGVAEKTVETNIVDCSNPCPVNGSYSEWSSWSTCSKTCGGGTQTRTRTYIPAMYGGVDLADRNILSESQSCNTQECSTAYKMILLANKSTTGPISTISPNGLYKFEWNKTPTLFLYKLTNGAWSEIAKIKIWNENNIATLSCTSESVTLYNSSYTASSTITTTWSRPIAGFAINDYGHVGLVNPDGKFVAVALTPTSGTLAV